MSIKISHFNITFLFMALSIKIRNFLNLKFKEHNIRKKHFAKQSNIPYPTIAKIFTNEHLNPELKTILKIANYFNCSIDEVLEQKNYFVIPEKYKFNDISLDDINYFLKNFLEVKLKEKALTQYNLGKNLGFNEHVIFDFMKKNTRQKILGSAVIVALADYFKVSIDEMIGRVSSSNQEPLQTTEPHLTSKNQ